MKKDSSSDSIQWLPRRERISIKQYQEVREYALSNGINLQGFKTSDVDIDLVKESIASIKEVTDTFPELLGSGRKKLTLSLSNTMSDEDFALSYEHLPHLIYLNGNAYRDATKLEAEYQKLVNDKWFVQGTDRKSIVKHELGHLYQSIHGITDEEIVSIALKSGHFNSREELFEFLSANLSIYSSEYLDGSEIISEVFSDYFSNSRPLDFSSNFIEELKKTK